MCPPARWLGGARRAGHEQAVGGSAEAGWTTDEPTAALDKESGLIAVELFCKQAYSQQSGIVMVTHDNQVVDMADCSLFKRDHGTQPKHTLN